MGRLTSIQGLRGLAALGVVLFHAGQWGGIDAHLGAAGVDVFFVISGVVMLLTTGERERTPLRFLGRRVGRVVPLYWLVTLAAAAIAMVVPMVRFDTQPEPAHVVQSLLFIPHVNPRGLPFPVVAQGWTLIYEAVFYGLFALALLLPRERQFLAVTVGLAAMTVVGVANPPLFTLVANPLLLEFALGMGLGRLWLMGSLPGGRKGWLLIGAGLVALAASWPVGAPDDPGNWRLIVWGLPAAAIVAGAMALEAAGRWPSWAWLQRLGDASYSLYLSHRLVVVLVYAALSPAPFAAPFLPVFLPVAILASVAAGFALHWAVERPLLRRLHGEGLRPRTSP